MGGPVLSIFWDRPDCAGQIKCLKGDDGREGPMVSQGVKAVGYSLAAVVLWITANLGAAFYVLMASYVVDFALNYDQKVEFVQRMTLYLGSTFFAYYLQNSAQFSAIPLLHGLIVAMASHEVIQVLAEAKNRLDAYKVKHPDQAADVTNLEALLAQAQALAPALLAATQTAQTTAANAAVKGEPAP